MYHKVVLMYEMKGLTWQSHLRRHLCDNITQVIIDEIADEFIKVVGGEEGEEAEVFSKFITTRKMRIATTTIISSCVLDLLEVLWL